MNENISEQFGELLKQFRKRRKLIQKQLAEKIEVSSDTVSLWERGQYKPETDGVLYDIVKVLNLTPLEKQQLFEAYTVTALTTSFHNPPFERNPYFTGRNAGLRQLHTLLTARKQEGVTQAISGLGGIGKTQLALEYAYRHQKSYHDIFWVNADTEESWMDSYVQLAGLLQLPEHEEADQNKAKDAMYCWLRKHTNWLLILDNVEDLRLLRRFVPEDRQGVVLLTTRWGVTEPVAQTLELDLLSENDAILFLLKRTKVLAVDRSLEDTFERDVEAARAIIRLLGNLPLALDQAAAYILETPCSFADYLALFQTFRNQLLERRIAEHIPTDHPESVTETFTLNFQQVERRNPAAGALLRLCAFLAPDAIAEEIIAAAASSPGWAPAQVAADALHFNKAIETLYAYSLVKRDPKGKTLSIHRLVQNVIQGALEDADRQVWAMRALAVVNATFPNVVPESLQQCGRLLTQAIYVTCWIEQYNLVSAEAGRLLTEMASYLQYRGPHAELEPFYRRALYIWEQLLGPEHPKVADVLNFLGTLYHFRCQYAKAEQFCQQALHIWEQQLGPEHPKVADALNNLAIFSFDQGKYGDAELLHLRALRICERQSEPDYDRMAAFLLNLAEVYGEQDRYAEAEPLFFRALSIWEQQLGPEHSRLGYPLDGLADLYRRQGRYGEAEPLYQRALSIWEEQLGETYTELANTLDGLATLYREQYRYAEAEILYQRSLHIWEQQGGPEHVRVASSLHGLANLYKAQGKHMEAKPLYKRALTICEHILGTIHPTTQAIQTSYTALLEAMSE